LAATGVLVMPVGHAMHTEQPSVLASQAPPGWLLKMKAACVGSDASRNPPLSTMVRPASQTQTLPIHVWWAGHFAETVSSVSAKIVLSATEGEV
jgi:hypothetical protein